MPRNRCGACAPWPTSLIARLGVVALLLAGCDRSTPGAATPPPPAAIPPTAISDEAPAAKPATEPSPAAAKPDATTDAPKEDPAPVGAAAETGAEAGEASTDTPKPEAEVTERRVLVVGDSIAATGFGAVLEKMLDRHPHVRAYRKAKSSSGLARPDFYNWMVEAKRQVQLRDPDLVVVVIGGNDGQDLQGVRKKDGRTEWGDPKWPAGYAERMREFLDLLSEGRRRVLWIALPKMGMRSLERKLGLIRDVQREAVEALGDRGIYLETDPMLTEGEALRKTAVVDRKARPIRADDGVHFTMAGSRYFAAEVYPHVITALGLEEKGG